MGGPTANFRRPSCDGQLSRGTCRVRDGHTVLIRTEDAGTFETREATLEEIMIHLEKEADKE